MILDYGTLLSPAPITLSVGTIKKPRLRDIAGITFSTFNMYEVFLKCTPKNYFTKILKNNGGIEKWDSLSDDERDALTMYSLILEDEHLQKLYVDIFEFFFCEHVAFREEFFILFNDDFLPNEQIPIEAITGIISEKNFQQITRIIQQICCIFSKSDETAMDQKFKNDLARKLFEKMQKAQKEQEENSNNPANKNTSLENVISVVSSNHPSINLVNVWDLTIFQLYDSFQRLQMNHVYDISATRVAVWGDEKNQFKQDLWHKNYHDS